MKSFEEIFKKYIKNFGVKRKFIRNSGKAESVNIKTLNVSVAIEEPLYNKIKGFGVLDDECINDIYKAIDGFVKRMEENKHGN